MCNPIAMVALSVASGVLQYSAQNKAVQAQYDAAEQQTNLMYQQITEKEQQINQQSQLEQSERIKQGMIERAQIKTIAGESGAIGFSSDRLVGDSYMQQSMDIGSMETNRQNAIRQAEWEKKQAHQGGASSVAQAKASAPSLLGTGLQIGSDIYSVYSTTEKKTKAKTGVE